MKRRLFMVLMAMVTVFYVSGCNISNLDVNMVTDKSANTSFEESVSGNKTEWDMLPSTLITDSIREIEYINNFPVIYKSVNNEDSNIYCLEMNLKYEGGLEYHPYGYAAKGYAYIFNDQHLPNTGDKEKDFYILQLAVWYFEDYLHNNNDNLESQVKKYIIRHSGELEGCEDETEEVSKLIYGLYKGAKEYEESDESNLGAVPFYRCGDGIQDIIYPVCIDVKYDTDPLASAGRLTNEEKEFDSRSFETDRRILFERDSSNNILNKEGADEMLKPYIDRLLEDKEYAVILGGFSESRENSDVLALERAETVGKLLSDGGADPNRIYVCQLNGSIELYAVDRDMDGNIMEDAAKYNRCCFIASANDNFMAHMMNMACCKKLN